MNIQQAAATENQRPGKNDQTQIEGFHETRYEREYQKLWEADQYHGFAGLSGAVILDLLKIFRQKKHGTV